MFYQLIKWFENSRSVPQLCYVLLVLGIITPTATSATDKQKPVREIVEGIKQAHARLLHAPGGLGLQYRLDVEQDRSNPSFIWMNGLDGLLNIRWPRMRSRIEGEMFKFRGKEKRLVSEKNVREANYDFESNCSVGHDGTALGQITNFRHSFSANTAFPLNFQYYTEMDQFYNPSEPLKTEWLLPDALEQHEYQWAADEEDVEGTKCAVLKRASLDTIWIATSKSYIICKREQRLASGGLYARMLSTDIREVAPGLWIPYKQIQEVYNPDQPDARIFKLTLRITKVTIPIDDEDTKVVLGKDIKHIENFMDKKAYYPQQPSGVRDYVSLSRSIKIAKDGYRNKTSSGKYVRIILFSVFVGAMILCIYLRFKRRKISC